MNTFIWRNQKINLDQFYNQWSQISGGTYVLETPTYATGQTYSFKGQLFTAFTTNSSYQDTNINLSDYPMDFEGYPNAPLNTETYFFKLVLDGMKPPQNIEVLIMWY